VTKASAVSVDAPSSASVGATFEERTNCCEAAIRTFFDAFNRRSLPDMADAVAEDCEHCNLAYPTPYRGKQAVVRFYQEFMKAVPRHAKFEIEDTTGSSSSGTIGVIW
jgi:ketosteroid isomerase-like protein